VGAGGKFERDRPRGGGGKRHVKRAVLKNGRQKRHIPETRKGAKTNPPKREKKENGGYRSYYTTKKKSVGEKDHLGGKLGGKKDFHRDQQKRDGGVQKGKRVH